MAIIPYPAPARQQRVELQPFASALQTRSELTNARQTLDVGYSWWEASVTVATMELDAARAWRVFFGRVRGPVHSFRLPITSMPQHSGAFTVKAQGAGSGYSLVTDGWPASATPLLAGDYVTVGDQLMVLDTNVLTSSTGVATLAFHSPLRRVVADNTIIETRVPHLLAGLPQNAPALALTIEHLQDGFSFNVVEAY